MLFCFKIPRYLALTGEYFAVVAEGSQCERDVTRRFPAGELPNDTNQTSLHQLELCTRCLISGQLQPAKSVLDMAASSEESIPMLLQGVEELQRMFPECVQRDMVSHSSHPKS